MSSPSAEEQHRGWTQSQLLEWLETSTSSQEEGLPPLWQTSANHFIAQYVSEEVQAPSVNLRELILEVEKRIITCALLLRRGCQKDAASLLGVKPTALHEKMKRLQLHSKPLAQ